MTLSIVAVGFTSFVERAVGVQLTTGQRVVSRVCFDGVDPSELSPEERVIARAFFGDVDHVPPGARDVIAIVAGARGGKSYVFVALRLLHLALTVPLDTLAPGEIASALIVAPDTRLGKQTLRYALGAARKIKRLDIENEREDSFTIHRYDKRSVKLEVLPATKGGAATRGRSLVAAALDEACFFRDENYSVNDDEVFAAIAPRVVPGGQVIIASTPWAADVGLLANLFDANHGKPDTALAVHAPTARLRSDDKTLAMIERERKRDPDNAKREFDAEFMAAGSGLFFDSLAVDACVDGTRPLSLPPSLGLPVGCGADFGFRSDSSALAIVANKSALFELMHIEELRPQRGAPLVPSETADRFASSAGIYGARRMSADSHYAEAIRERLSRSGMTLLRAPEGVEGKARTYLYLRELIHSRRIRFPDHPRLVAQLKAVVSKPQPGGGLSISSPRSRTGGHGDLVSAVVLAAWEARQSFSASDTPGFIRVRGLNKCG